MEVIKSGSMRAVALTNTDSESWELFPIALYRIHKFAKSYDSDAEVVKLVASMKYCFAIGGDALIMLLLDGRTVIGHMLVSMESWYGTKFATISQYELDKAMPHDIATASLEFAERWAKDSGARFMQALARNEKLARAFTTFHGFERDRIMLRKPLSTGVAAGAETS